MASIYFYYNEVLQQSAQAASARAMVSSSSSMFAACGTEHQGLDPQEQEQEFQDKPTVDAHEQEHDNQQNERPARDPEPLPEKMLPDSEAERAALQPRLNKLAYLQTAVATNLEALARALGPKQ